MKSVVILFAIAGIATAFVGHHQAKDNVVFNLLGKANVMFTPFDSFNEFDLKLYETGNMNETGIRYIAYEIINDGKGEPSYDLFCIFKTVNDLVDFDQYLAFCGNARDNGTPYYLRVDLKYDEDRHKDVKEERLDRLPIDLKF